MKLARLDSEIGRAQNAYDVFVALDDAGKRLGKCSIVPYKADELLPDCPFNIFIDLDGTLESMDMLIGAALASVVETAGAVCALLAAMPLLRAVLELVTELR